MSTTEKEITTAAGRGCGAKTATTSSSFSSQKAPPSTDEKRSEEEAEECLLADNPNRWVILPIHYPKIWNMYKAHQASFWTAEEIDLGQDTKDWDLLTKDEQRFIKVVLAFFAASDGIVLENIAARFLNDVQLPEARAFYGFQIAMENIHSETYSLLIDHFVKDQDEKNALLDATSSFPCVQKKADWAAEWINSDRSFAERLVAFAAVEGILFSGSFCALFWLKKRGILPGLTFSNELISRDEGLHSQFACLLYSMLKRRLSTERVHEIVNGAVEVEEAFICEALPCQLIGIESAMMGQYIRVVADTLLEQLEVPKLFKVRNPFDWMDVMHLQGKANVFERRVAEYQKSGVAQGVEHQKFSIDADF